MESFESSEVSPKVQCGHCRYVTRTHILQMHDRQAQAQEDPEAREQVKKLNQERCDCLNDDRFMIVKAPRRRRRFGRSKHQEVYHRAQRSSVRAKRNCFASILDRFPQGQDLSWFTNQNRLDRGHLFTIGSSCPWRPTIHCSAKRAGAIRKHIRILEKKKQMDH